MNKWEKIYQHPEQYIGQLFVAAAFIHDTEKEISEIESLIRDHHIGGLCFFYDRRSAAANNADLISVRSSENDEEILRGLIVRYRAASSIPLLIMIDAEWGLNMRLPEKQKWPYALSLAALKNPEYIEDVAYIIGLECKTIDIDLNLAPVVDINDEPNNPVIGFRAFGDSRDHVTLCAEYYASGLQKAGVLSCLKHFPGHGNTVIDSHVQTPSITGGIEDLWQHELHPYKMLHDKVDVIMAGHLRLPDIIETEGKPATLSSYVLQDLLRDRIGFKGLVLSDAMNMRGIYIDTDSEPSLCLQAIEAGCDMLCYVQDIKASIDYMQRNVSTDILKRSLQHIIALKQKRQKPQEVVSKDIDISLTRKKVFSESAILIGDYPKYFQRIKTYNAPEEIINLFRLHYPDQVPQQDDTDLYDALVICIDTYKASVNYDLTEDQVDHLRDLFRSRDLFIIWIGNPYGFYYITEGRRPQRALIIPESDTAAVRAVLKSISDGVAITGQLPFHYG